MQIKPCQPYHAVLADKKLIHGADEAPRGNLPAMLRIALQAGPRVNLLRRSSSGYAGRVSGAAKRNCAEANPASPVGLRRDRLAILTRHSSFGAAAVHPCGISLRRASARQEPQGILAKANKKSAFKIYFINIIGRATPGRYEWPKAAIPKDQFIARFHNIKIDGVGFVTAFAHVTKLFRFDPTAETVLNVRAFSTTDLAPLDLKRAGDYLEFACYAEVLLAASEYHLWAGAETVPEYLSVFSSFDDGRIISNAKLANYFNPPGLPAGLSGIVPTAKDIGTKKKDRNKQV